jgi:malate synthase
VSLDTAPTQDDRLAEEILSDDALAFVGELHGRFGARRNELLQARSERGAPSGFLQETREIREDS